MATVSPPRRHASGLFHRRHSHHRMSRFQGQERISNPHVFEGTDTVAQNKRVALQRALDVYDALDLKHTEAVTGERPKSSASMSSDRSTFDLSTLPFPDTEVRTFRYFLRMWDPSTSADPEFDEAVKPSKPEFEETAIKYFFRRIARWNEDEDSEETKGNMTRGARGRQRSKSQLEKLRTVQKDLRGHSSRDELKEVTTREGLAQLLWRLLYHDPKKPLDSQLSEECTKALKKKYGIKSLN